MAIIWLVLTRIGVGVVLPSDILCRDPFHGDLADFIQGA
jgi:hypothetical protein